MGRLAGSGEHRDDAQLLPELSDRTQDSGLGDFAAESMLQLRDRGVARFKKFVGLDRERRNLTRARQLRAATPITIAAQRVDIGQNPCCDNEVGLLAWLSQKVQPNNN